MDLLARREHSALELSRKLKKRFDDEALIAAVLEGLRQDNLLSHERFAESFARMRANQGFGPEKIRYELMVRGIEEMLINNSLEALESQWSEKIYHVWKKKFNEEKPTGYPALAKQQRFLQYRGFTTEQIHHLFNEGIQ